MLIFSGPCTRIISSILHSFLHFLRAINVISYMKYSVTAKKRFLWELKKTNFKSFKFHKMKSYAWWFYPCFLNSCEIWNLFSKVSIRNCLWRYYRWLSPWKVYKKKVIWPKIFWYKVFISWKLKLLSFVVDSVLIIYTRFFFSVHVLQFPFSGWIWIWFEVKLAPFLSLILSSFIKDTSRIKLAFKKPGKFAFNSCFQNKTHHC